MSDFHYDKTFQAGYNPNTSSGNEVPSYNNVGQLQTPYFGKRFGIAGDYGPIYSNPFDPHRTPYQRQGNNYDTLEDRLTAYGPDLNFPSPFTPPAKGSGVYVGYPPHAPTYERPADVHYVRGSSLIGAVVFPGRMGLLPVRDGISYFKRERDYG